MDDKGHRLMWWELTPAERAALDAAVNLIPAHIAVTNLLDNNEGVDG